MNKSEKYIHGRKFVSGTRAAEIIGVSGANFRLWRKNGVYVPELEKERIGKREFYSLQSVKRMAHGYTPFQRVEKARKPSKDDLLEAIAKLEEVIKKL